LSADLEAERATNMKLSVNFDVERFLGKVALGDFNTVREMYNNLVDEYNVVGKDLNTVSEQHRAALENLHATAHERDVAVKECDVAVKEREVAVKDLEKEREAREELSYNYKVVFDELYAIMKEYNVELSDRDSWK
jgi:hypothetical protein